jgi:hypothetical protein
MEKRGPRAAASVTAMDITIRAGFLPGGSGAMGPPVSGFPGFEAAGQHIGLVPGGGPQGMASLLQDR